MPLIRVYIELHSYRDKDRFKLLIQPMRRPPWPPGGRSLLPWPPTSLYKPSGAGQGHTSTPGRSGLPIVRCVLWGFAMFMWFLARAFCFWKVLFVFHFVVDCCVLFVVFFFLCWYVSKSERIVFGWVLEFGRFRITKLSFFFNI